MIVSTAEIMKRVPASEQRDYVRPGESRCGTAGGFTRHRRRGESICAPCREAENQRKRALRARKKASKS